MLGYSGVCLEDQRQQEEALIPGNVGEGWGGGTCPLKTLLLAIKLSSVQNSVTLR